ncbi:MAG: sigma-54 dependent transcriptional regulator [Candidatus Sumerlaeaceae bacterium]|nr:sigma-54 dependent transcriptional regulator [Candidatus Sumerlaeaceae bacterium]
MIGRPRILIAEDEERLRRLLGMLLSDTDYEVKFAADGEEAIRLFASEGFDLVVTDMRMPGADGMQVLEAVKTHRPDVPVVVMTAFGSIESAVEAMRAGAVDYVTKPFEAERFKLSLERALGVGRLLSENWQLRREVRERHNLEHIVAESPAMQRVLQAARQVAASNATVLLTGPSGCGKEVITRFIHELSPRARGPFVAVNCAAIPENLLESDLFGHERGAFTGATERKVGKFELASGGTLFLDEIAEMPLALQAKVLRAIETQVIERVGSTRSIKTDIRFIAATNARLAEAVAAGRFRGDLFFRLNVFPIEIPSLSERRADIMPLTQLFLEKACAQMGKRVPSIPPETRRLIEHYAWPGNVRELQNAVERATILLTGERLLPELLGIAGTGLGAVSGGSMFTIPASGFSLEEHERSLLVQALQRTGYNKSRAARLLGVSRATLRYRLEKFGLLDAPAAGEPQRSNP